MPPTPPPSAAGSVRPSGGRARYLSSRSRTPSSSFSPALFISFMPLSSNGLWLADMAMPTSKPCARAAYATAGVVATCIM